MGTYFIADKFAEPSIVAQRIATTEQIMNVLGFNEHWEIYLQTEVHRHRHAEGLFEKIKISEMVPEGDRHYFWAEILDAGVLVAPDGVKVGWAIDDKPFRGGEVHFDQEIHQNFPGISFKYTWPGLRFSGLKESPYLTRYPAERIMIVSRRADISREILKITVQTNAGVAEMLEQISRRIIVGTETPIDFPKFRKRIIGDVAIVNRVRERVEAALEKFTC